MYQGSVEQTSQGDKTWHEMKACFFAATNLLPLDTGPSHARPVVEGLLLDGIVHALFLLVTSLDRCPSLILMQLIA
jgi:hypothetical protein